MLDAPYVPVPLCPRPSEGPCPAVSSPLKSSSGSHPNGMHRYWVILCYLYAGSGGRPQVELYLDGLFDSQAEVFVFLGTAVFRYDLLNPRLRPSICKTSTYPDSIHYPEPIAHSASTSIGVITSGGTKGRREVHTQYMNETVRRPSLALLLLLTFDKSNLESHSIRMQRLETYHHGHARLVFQLLVNEQRTSNEGIRIFFLISTTLACTPTHTHTLSAWVYISLLSVGSPPIRNRERKCVVASL